MPTKFPKLNLSAALMRGLIGRSHTFRAKTTPADKHGQIRAWKKFKAQLAKNKKRPKCDVMTRQRLRWENRTADKRLWRMAREARVAARKSANKAAA